MPVKKQTKRLKNEDPENVAVDSLGLIQEHQEGSDDEREESENEELAREHYIDVGWGFCF